MKKVTLSIVGLGLVLAGVAGCQKKDLAKFTRDVTGQTRKENIIKPDSRF
jgi:hypothetical protein